MGKHILCQIIFILMMAGRCYLENTQVWKLLYFLKMDATATLFFHKNDQLQA
jgi:hypothetical protein